MVFPEKMTPENSEKMRWVRAEKRFVNCFNYLWPDLLPDRVLVSAALWAVLVWRPWDGVEGLLDDVELAGLDFRFCLIGTFDFLTDGEDVLESNFLGLPSFWDLILGLWTISRLVCTSLREIFRGDWTEELGDSTFRTRFLLK